MEVILLERVGKIGNLGETVNVKAGFARNFLLPKGKALRATKANLEIFEAQRAEIEKRNEEAKEEAAKLAGNIDGAKVIIIRAASDSGALFGSVTPRDISDALNAAGYEVTKNVISLSAPIKELGLHDVAVNLHAEIVSSVSVNVARSEEEAVLQESGATIQSVAADAEAEAEAELSAMLDEIGSAVDEDAMNDEAND